MLCPESGQYSEGSINANKIRWTYSFHQQRPMGLFFFRHHSPLLNLPRRGMEMPENGLTVTDEVFVKRNLECASARYPFELFALAERTVWRFPSVYITIEDSGQLTHPTLRQLSFRSSPVPPRTGRSFPVLPHKRSYKPLGQTPYSTGVSCKLSLSHHVCAC